MMNKTRDNARYGIHIKKYCQAHEGHVLRQLETSSADPALLALHARKIGWLQHERLVHLIVVFVFSVLFLFSIGLYLVLLNPFALVLTVIVMAVLGVYIRHYFILENKVQYWYTLFDDIYIQIHK